IQRAAGKVADPKPTPGDLLGLGGADRNGAKLRWHRSASALRAPLAHHPEGLTKGLHRRPGAIPGSIAERAGEVHLVFVFDLLLTQERDRAAEVHPLGQDELLALEDDILLGGQLPAELGKVVE